MTSNRTEGTALLAGAARELVFQRYRLTVTAGPDAGRELVADGTELSVGTAPGCNLVLTDVTVSRHHCVVVATGRGYLLRDLGSTNGTKLEGFGVREAYLEHGATIGVGTSALRFQLLDEQIREPLAETDHHGALIGQSPAMRRIYALLPRIAGSDATVLLEGETGSGKGLLAEAIHAASARAQRPLVVVDCASLPPNLVESELFGHEKGAFTGAHAARAGAFEQAQGGTVFLDEIGELPLEQQPKLLRALEEREVKRVGGGTRLRLDVRLLAATNRDLRHEVNRGGFRMDLYYRLNTVRVRIPPLRERREDVPLLVDHFYRQLAPQGGAAPAELIEALSRHDWPGNVRELRGAVERTLLLGEPQLWEDLRVAEESEAASEPSTDFDAALSYRAAKELAIRRWERTYLKELLAQNGGNLAKAARMARTDRNHLRERVRRLKLDADDDD